MKKIAVFLAEGFEEVEALTPVDVLRRANMDVITISISKSKEVTGSHAITVIADQVFDDTDFSEFDAIILPGGMPGTNNLNQHQALKELLIDFSNNNKLIGAICAAPMVIGELGLLKGKNAICYPGFEDKLSGAVIQQRATVCDGGFITANGVGSSMKFALSLVRELCDDETANELARKMMVGQ